MADLEREGDGGQLGPEKQSTERHARTDPVVKGILDGVMDDLDRLESSLWIWQPKRFLLKRRLSFSLLVRDIPPVLKGDQRPKHLPLLQNNIRLPVYGNNDGWRDLSTGYGGWRGGQVLVYLGIGGERRRVCDSLAEIWRGNSARNC